MVSGKVANIARSIRDIFISRKDYIIYRLDKYINKNKSCIWYHAGAQETCKFLESIGLEIVNPDVGLCVRDPIIHFRRPL